MRLLQYSAALAMFLLVVASYVEAVSPDLAPPPTDPGLCDSKCQSRCKNAGVQVRCQKYCGYCCRKCNCVPSGTFGNKEECPCYRDMLTKNKKSKCP